MSAFPIQSAKSGVVVAPIQVTMTDTDVGSLTIGKNVATLTSAITASGVVTLVISPQWRRGLMAVQFMGGGIVRASSSQTQAVDAGMIVDSIDLDVGTVVIVSGYDIAADTIVHITLGLVYRPDRKGFE